jgi:hypothetical protein
MQELTLNGSISQQQRQQLQWQRTSSRLLQQQHGSILDSAGVSPHWQQQQQFGSRRQQQDGGYSPYGSIEQQQARLGIEQQLGRGSVGSFKDASRKQQQQQQAKQKGRLGRMASRIYALRPRMLRGEQEECAVQKNVPSAWALTACHVLCHAVLLCFNAWISLQLHILRAALSGK